jgi:hypothetical protein
MSLEFDIVFDKKIPDAPKELNILCSVVSARDVKPQFTARFWHLGVVTTRMSMLGNININKLDSRCGAHQSSLSASRQHHLDEALKGGYSHIFMLDDDQDFPPDTLIRLVSHRKPVVFPNICQKKPDAISGVVLDFDGKRIDSRGRTGIEQVGTGTLACTLIDLDCIRPIPRPHFPVAWNEAAQRYQGEDHALFDRMRAHGVEFWMDNDLSQEVYHIGDYPYGFTKANV